MDMSTIWGIVLVPAVLVAVVMVVGLAVRSGRRIDARRADRLRGAAAALGLRYYGDPGPDALEALPDLPLLEGSYDPAVTNLISDGGDPPGLLLFDCRHTRGPDWQQGRPGGLEIPLLHLVAMAALPDGACRTPFRVYREDWFGAPVGVRNGYHLESDEKDDEFADQCLVVGEPREDVCAMLTVPVRRAITAWSMRGLKPAVEVGPDWVTAWVETERADARARQRAVALAGYVVGIAGALREGQAG